MIGPVPEFTKSEYFSSKPRWHLEEGAPQDLIEEFEKFMNSKTAVFVMKKDHPEMVLPYYSWTGKVIDKGRADDSDDDGRWVTTENKHKVFIDENGNPTKGNPHVIEKMTGDKRSKEDFLPKTSYWDTPECRDIVNKLNESSEKADEIWTKRQQLEKEMESEFTPKRYSDITDDEIDHFGYCGTRPGILTDKGLEMEREEKRLWKEYQKADWDRSSAQSELEIKKWQARANELKKYVQPELKKAENADYEGFTTETTGTTWGDEILKSGNAFIAEMSPKEYLERCAFEIFYSGTLESTIAPVHMEDVSKYSEMMKNGTKFDLPWLDYEDGGQEGRHRAVAAYLLGIDKIPVLIAGAPPMKSEMEERIITARKEAQKVRRELRKKESERMDSSDEGRWITTKTNHKVHLNENGEPDMGNPYVIEKMAGGEPEKLAYAKKKYRSIEPKLKSKKDELDAYNREIKRKDKQTDRAKAELEKAKTAVQEAKARKEKIGGKSADEIESESRDAYYDVERCKRALKYLEEERNSGNESDVLDRLRRNGFTGFQNLDEAVSMIEEHRNKKKAEYDSLTEISNIINRYGRDGGVRKSETALSEYEKELQRCEKNAEETKNRRDSIESEYNTIRGEAEEARKYYYGFAKKELVSIDYCKTTEEVETMLDAGGYFRDGTSANLGNLDVESAKYIANAVDQLAERYPYLKGKIAPIETRKIKGADLGGYSPEQKCVTLNSDVFEDIDALEERYRKSTEEGTHPYGTSADAIIFHEYAHQIDDLLSGEERFATTVLKKVAERMNESRPSMVKDLVSEYATREYPYNKDGDFFAEALSEYLSSSKPREVAKLVGQIFEREISKRKQDNRMDADEDEDTGGGNHGNTRIPFGLCQREGIEIGKDWTPEDAWKALEGKGYSPDEVYKNLKETGKATKEPAKREMSDEEANEIVRSYRETKTSLENKKKLAERLRTEASNDANYARFLGGELAKFELQEEQAKFHADKVPESKEALEKELEEIQSRRNVADKKWKWSYKVPKQGTKARKEYDKKLEEAGGYDKMMEDRNKDFDAIDPDHRKRYLEDNLYYFNEYEKRHRLTENKRSVVEDYENRAKQKWEQAETAEKEVERLEKELSGMEEDYQEASKFKFSSYDTCESFDDVEEKMRRDGCLKGGEKPFWGEIELDTVKQIATHIGTFYEKVPEMKGLLGTPYVKEMEQGIFAGSEGTKNVVLNDRYFSYLKVLESSLEECIKEGFHPEGVKVDSVILHEYSHQMDSYLTQKFFEIDQSLVMDKETGELFNFSTRVLRDVCKNLNMSEKECKDAVSKYASKDYLFLSSDSGFFNGKNLEFFAEAMSEYMSSYNPRPVAVEVWNVTQKYLKKLHQDSRMDEDEEEGGNHGNTKIPFGLCEREGIEIQKGWTPSDAWEALKGKGYSPSEVYENLKKTGKASKSQKMSEEEAGGHVGNYRRKRRDVQAERKKLGDLKEEAIAYESKIQGQNDYYVRKAEKDLEEKRKDYEKVKTGKTIEQLENEQAESQKVLEDFNEELKKFRPPLFGTPEREEYDKWEKEQGGWEAVERQKNEVIERSKPAMEKDLKIRKELAALKNLYNAEDRLEIEKEKVADWEKELELTRRQIAESEKKVSEMETYLEENAEKYKEAVNTLYPTYDDCKNYDEMEEKLRANGCLSNDKSFYLESIPFENGAPIVKQIADFYDRVPEMRNRLGSVDVEWMSGAYAGSLGHSQILINPDKFQDMDALRKTFQGDLDNKYHPEGTDLSHIVYHEMAHQMDSYLTTVLRADDIKKSWIDRKNFSTVVLEEVSENLGMSKGDVKKAVSKYAEKRASEVDPTDDRSLEITGFYNGDDVEFYAEAIGEYMSSKTPRPVAREVWKVTQKYLKQYEKPENA